jgi:hypothetical protein
MQRRAVTRTVALVSRPQQATMMLGARRLNTNSTSTGPVSTLNTLIETTKDSKEGTHAPCAHQRSLSPSTCPDRDALTTLTLDSLDAPHTLVCRLQECG